LIAAPLAARRRAPAAGGRRRCLPALLAACLGVIAAPAPAASGSEPCDAIRSRIGRLSPGDGELLRTLAARQQECGFTAAEVYQAAHGDKPVPRHEEETHRRHHGHDDDEE
jgi:hypothetical protein